MTSAVKGESIRWTNSSRTFDTHPSRAFIMKSIRSVIICISVTMYGDVVSVTDGRLVSCRSCLFEALLPSGPASTLLLLPTIVGSHVPLA